MDRNYARDENLPEVVPDSSPEALSQAELYKKHGYDGGEGKFPYVPGDGGEKYTPDPSPLSPTAGGVAQLPGRPEETSDTAPAGTGEERRICGVKRKTFWILVGVAILAVIAIAVGAGVGATRGSGGGSSDSQGQNESDGASSTSSAPASATTSSPASDSASASSALVTSSSTSSEEPSSATSSSAEATPTFLNNQTAPDSFAFQAFSDLEYGGNASVVYKEEGFINLDFDARSYVWLNNGSTCCVTFCQGRDEDVGYRCDDRRQPNASSWLDRVSIWCGMDHDEQKNRCS